jgi:hypothetical protein
VTIFNQIYPDGSLVPGVDPTFTPPSATQSSHTQLDDLDLKANQGAEMLKQLLNKFNLGCMKDPVIFWLAKGVSLALAEPIVKQCAETMDHLRATLLSHDTDWQLTLTRHLKQNSDRPLDYDEKSTLSSFVSQFCDRNVRWETLGIFLTAVIRATFDVPFFPSLYTTETERNDLQRLATRLSNSYLELCLSLGCLNDLQLIFQYENFIVHSYVDGDQSRWNPSCQFPSSLII